MSPDGTSKQPTPEERLLNLIRSQQSSPATAANLPSSLAKGKQGKGKAKQSLALSAPSFNGKLVVVWLLGALLLGELGFLVYEVQKPLPLIETQVPTPRYVSESELSLPEPPVSLANAAQGDLFVPPIAVASTQKKAGPSEAAKDLSSRLTLMGVIEGDPSQAIIEDSANQKTHFSMQGQMVVDGAYLEEVKSNMVTLDLDGEKIHLNL